MISVRDMKQQNLKDTIQKDESKIRINFHIYCSHRIAGKRAEIEDRTYLEEIFESSKIFKFLHFQRLHIMMGRIGRLSASCLPHQAKAASTEMKFRYRKEKKQS